MLQFLLLSMPLPQMVVPEDAGPYQVSVQDVSHVDHHYSRGTVEARVYYPSDPTNGPFPLAAFMHGWIQPASDYDELCTHIASHGYVVYSNNTETSLFATLQAQAHDTRAGLQWVEDQSQLPSSFLYGMTDNQPWIAIGHSMGGAGVASLCRIESRTQVAVMLEPYKGVLLGNTSNAFGWFSNFTGSLLVIGATEDLTNNWSSQVKPWYNTSSSSTRKLWSLINGGDHFGACDADIHALWGFGSLVGSEQHLAHRRLLTSFLLSEVGSNENYYFDFINTNNCDPEASSKDTPMWLRENPQSPGALEMGTFTGPNSSVRIAASNGVGFTPSVFGDILLDLNNLRVIHSGQAPSSGIVEFSLPLRSGWSGMTLYFQALSTASGAGSISRRCEFVVI